MMWTSSCSFFFFFFVVVLCRTARRTVRRSSVPTACNSSSSYTDKLLATTTTRPTPNHARHATPTPATPTPRVSRSAENASCVCSENAFSFSFTSLPPLFVRCTFCVVIFFLSLSFSHLAPRTVSLPSFLFSGSSFFLGLHRVT